jgi:DNA replication protein DnaC
LTPEKRQEIAKTNKPVRFWKYSELLRKLGDAAKTDAKYRCFTRQLKQPGLLIIDDFGAKTATPPQLDAVYDLLSESRNTSPLIIWITMNCSLGDYHDQHNRSIQSGRICARLEKFLFVHSVYLDKEPPREHPTLNI